MGKGFQLKTGLNADVRYVSEHATAGSFVAGDIVDLNGGKVRIASSDQAIYGVAAAPATGTVDTQIPVYVVDPSQLWVAYADGTVTEATHTGNDYGLNIAAGSCTVDLGDATTTTVSIIDIDERDAYATTARVIVRFKNAILQSQGA